MKDLTIIEEWQEHWDRADQLEKRAKELSRVLTMARKAKRYRNCDIARKLDLSESMVSKMICGIRTPTKELFDVLDL